MTDYDNFSHSATILPVKDIQDSIEFYTEKLQFKMTFSWGSPLNYAVLKKGGVSIHLVAKEDNLIPSKRHCALYIFVHDVDKIFQRCKKEKVTVLNVPELREYKMNDFDIKDPDGYIITFGTGE